MNDIDASNSAAAVERAIRERRTLKHLAAEPLPPRTDRSLIERLVASAGWAPFHHVAASRWTESGVLRSPMPWRFRLLDAATCRRLREWLLAREEKGPAPRLLAACEALVLASWLPNPPTAELPDPATQFEGTRDNMEHIAAAAAAVQNLLIAATAHGLPTFWATGGPLRAPETLARLQVPENEVLLGAVYLFPASAEGVERKTGSLRERRGSPEEWSRWTEFRGDDELPIVAAD